MSAFNFDPFASSAPPASTGAPAPNSASSTAATATQQQQQQQQQSTTPAAAGSVNNPFDNLGLFVQPSASGTSTAASASGGWQQNARAAMQNSSVWKSATTLSTSTSQHDSSSTSLNNNSNNIINNNPPKQKVAKRIVPYNSPISTLETNWDPWLHIAQTINSPQQQQQQQQQSLWKNNGNTMTYLVVKANQGCCLHGGVESVLKYSKSSKKGASSGSSALGLDGEFDSSLTFSTSDEQQQQQQQQAVESNTTSSHITKSLGNTSTTTSGGGITSMGGSMRFLKSGLKKAQASIERGVTTMAIKADGGKNRDQLCVSLHYCGGLHSPAVNLSMWNALGLNGSGVVGHGVGLDVGDVCLSRTEWMEFPPSATAAAADNNNNNNGNNGDDSEGGALFSIPLCVPDLGFLEAVAAAAGQQQSGLQLMVRLYLRSGATLLKAVANAGLKREYCIGESALLYSNLMGLTGSNSVQQQEQQQQQQQSAGGGGLRCGTINVPFTSGMLAEPSSFSNRNGDAPAALHITATPRVKFNPVCSYGWSLTDPITTPPSLADPSSWLKTFQLPLDQGYVYEMPGQHLHHHRLLNNGSSNQPPSNSAVLLANERAVESCVTLPLATACSQLFSIAATQSQQLALSAANNTHRKSTVYLSGEDEYRSKAVVEAALLDGCADVEVGVVALILLGDAQQQYVGPDDLGAVFGGCGVVDNVPYIPSARIKTNVSFQPSHTIFEETLVNGGSCPLLDEESGASYINNPASAAVGPDVAISTRFCPRIFTGIEPDLLPGLAGTKQGGKYVGSMRLEVIVAYANSAIDNISTGISGQTAIEGTIELENYIDDPRMSQGTGKVPVLVPAIDANTGKRIGTFVLLMRVVSGNTSAQNEATVNTPASTSSGLVSVVGLDTLLEESGLAPLLDSDAPSADDGAQPTAASVKRRQVATMGSFVSPRFLINQANVVRENDASEMSDRYGKYHKSLLSAGTSDDDSGVPLYQRRTPRPFRPSNSRGDALLSGIGFNVHVQSFSLNVLQDGNTPMQAALTQSVTHGAPADHVKGFGGQSSDQDGKIDDPSAPRGGLRRLESKRLEIAKELDECVSGLINSVGDHFKSRAQATAMRQQAGIKSSRHIPPIPAVTHYRTRAVECAQRLHSLTWDVAVRRANCFSQALGIAVTSYLASLSDGGPAWRGYASIWAKHGYLITFEGLLSAVGKELGMIEDAYVAISMLRMVNVVLVLDDANASPPPTDNTRQRIPVPHSPYIRWVHLIYLTTHGSHSKTQYRLEIGLDPSYYQSRVPEPLQHGAAVRFFPILFQMGVDIRQWGVNAGRSVTSQIKDKPKIPTAADFDDAIDDADTEPTVGSLLDDGDEDDEGGVADMDFLLALNVEAARKLNAYAHSVNPTTAGATAASAPIPVFDPLQLAQSQPLPLHPSLVSLTESVKASAGKMEHGVLDKAATACQRFGGGSTVFCKSGKDRTAMQVTFKQAQFAQRFMDKKESGIMLEDTQVSYDEVFAKSTTMRKHGNRIPVCEKNAGEPKFAFNPLQRKFMPPMLRPDASLCQWSKPET